MINGQNYCTNKRECVDVTTNRTFDCPLWQAYCGPLDAAARAANSNSSGVITKELRQSDLASLDDPVKQNYIHLCNYFQHDDSIQKRMGIPGVSNIGPITSKFINKSP